MTFDLRRCVLSTASVIALTATAPSLAQVAETAADETAEEIVVTGTNIRGAEVIGSVVQSLDAEDVLKSGKATVADLVRELPVNFAGGVASSDNSRGGQDTSSAGSNLTGGSGINLRGLGALSTLVLVNGRRVAVSGQFGDFVDISNIPVAAIERIEILQDGASAVYGSDAVGGVVNIILKKKQDGLTLLGRVGSLTEGGEMEYQGSATWGTSWGGGNLVVGYEYNRRENVLASERDFNGGDFSDRGGVNWPRYTSRAGRAANIFAGNAAFNGAVGFTVPQGPGTGLTVAQLTPAVGGFGNSFDPWENVDILPEMERHSVFGSIEHDVSEQLSVHAGGRYTKRDGLYNMGFPAFYGTLPATNPAFIPGNANNFGVLIDDQQLIRDVGVEAMAFEASARYELSDSWGIEAIGSYSREKQSRYSTLMRDTNVVERVGTAAAPSSIACSLQGTVTTAPNAAQAFCNARAYQAWNPYSTQPLSAQVVSQLIGYEDLTFTSRVLQGTLKTDGTLFTIGGGDVKVAAGIDWRREKIDGELDFNFRSINPTVVPYGATEQDVFAAFGEVAVPFVSEENARPGLARLDFSAAVRYEKSNDLSGFETTDPKFGLRFAPVEGFNLRGSWGTSFHAPPMRFQYSGPQPVPGGNAIFYANAFYTAPCNTNLVQLNGFTGTPGGAGNCTFTGMVVSGGAGPTLRPEKATTWSLGLDLEPPVIPNLKIGINYFNMEIEDRLVRITSGTLAGILANYFATGSSPYINNLDFNPDDALVQSLFNDPRFTGLSGPGPTRTASQVAAIIYATQTNLATLKMDGIDLSARYSFAAGDADIGLFGNGTLITSYNIQGTPGAAFQKKLGLYESTGNPVSFKAKVGASVDIGGFSGVLSLNHVGPYKCATGCYLPSATGAPVLSAQPIPIKAWNTFDLQLGYDLSSMGGALDGSRIAVSVNNLFNEEPPYIDTGRIANGNAPEPYDAANASIIGRQVALTLTKTF
ncbi:TonB-dependent receptor domain-containing protein [Sphingoaurantiacus capsulatus]|uniref:TonB-dependent receptor domain-containing protein n=1 Tax=Sphingoaurantiacus capsulatus TaxID=1771310 RepID=A0ABV7XCL8_9SPHN